MIRDARTKTSDLGTKEIHERHAVLIENEMVPRAKVMDQNIIDKLLMSGRINLAQHQAGEYFLEQAQKAGIFIKAQKYDSIPGGGVSDYVNYSAVYSNTVKMIRGLLSGWHDQLMHQVICEDRDITHLDDLVKEFVRCLDLIVDRRMSAFRNPLRHVA